VLCKEFNNYVDWQSNFVSENVEKLFIGNLPVSGDRMTNAQSVIVELKEERGAIIRQIVQVWRYTILFLLLS
jgi:hypothetical protein